MIPTAHSIMNTKAAQDKKAQLENDIQTLIETYEEDTGMTVQSLDIEHIGLRDADGESWKTMGVKAEVQL